MTPIVKLTNRTTGVTLCDTYGLPFDAQKISFDWRIPGGMTTADVEFPVDWVASNVNLNGARFEVYEGLECVWWGSVKSVGNVIRQGQPYRIVLAQAPWEIAKRKPFRQAYIAGPIWASEDIIKAALFGNVPDIALDYKEWTLPGLDFTPISWTDSNVQSVVTEVLRIGDTTTTPWSIIIVPPSTVYPPTTERVYDSNRWSSTTGWTLAGTVPTIALDMFARDGDCLACWHDTGAGNSSYTISALRTARRALSCVSATTMKMG